MTTHQFQPVLAALGSNLALNGRSSETIIDAAIGVFPYHGLEVLAISRFFSTPCFPAGAGPDYINAAVVIRPRLACDAASILAAFHRIEADFARSREQRWGMRTLDIDLLAMGDLVLPDPAVQDQWRALPLDQQIARVPEHLVLPHPRMQDRAFVLVPLAEVAPDWVHPRTSLSVSAMLQALPAADRAQVVPLDAAAAR